MPICGWIILLGVFWRSVVYQCSESCFGKQFFFKEEVAYFKSLCFIQFISTLCIVCVWFFRCLHLMMWKETAACWNIDGEYFCVLSFRKVEMVNFIFMLRSVPIVSVMHFLQTMRAQCFLTQLDHFAASRWQWHLKSQSSLLKELNPDVAPSVNGQNIFFSSGIFQQPLCYY